MDKLVSVVIPTSAARNRYLQRALMSVEKQLYRHLEVVVVIDGDSAETRSMVKDLALQIPLQVIETGDKVGGSEARNIGVRASKGAFVGLLDDDDEWYPDKILSQLRMIEAEGLTENDEFLCFTSLHRYRDINDAEYQKIPNVNYKDSGKVRLSDYLFETKGLRNVGFIQTSTVLVPRTLLLASPFTEGLPKHQDWDWLLKVDRNHDLKIIQVEEPKIIYHSDIPASERVGYINRWRFTEEWFESHRDEFSQNGRDSFILNYILQGINTDETMTEDQQKREIKRQLAKLSLKMRLSPYALKMWVYSKKERRSKK